MYFFSQFFILDPYFFKLFVVSCDCWILRFLFFFLFFLDIKFHYLIVTKLKVFSSLCIFSDRLHPTYHFLMNLLILSHCFYLFKIFLVNIFLLLSEIIITILLTIVLQTCFGDSWFKEWNQRV